VFMLANGESPFTLDDAVETLAETLGLDLANSVERSAARFVTREALRNGAWADGDPESGAPLKIVTFYDAELAGWVRVPFEHASLDQLAAMVAHRFDQLEELRASAETLKCLLNILRAQNARGTGGDKCGPRWRKAGAPHYWEIRKHPMAGNGDES
jgi:hypothetical protein